MNKSEIAKAFNKFIYPKTLSDCYYILRAIVTEQELEELIQQAEQKLDELKNKPISFHKKLEQLQNRIKECERGRFSCGEKADWGGVDYWDDEKTQTQREINFLCKEESIKRVVSRIEGSEEYKQKAKELATSIWDKEVASGWELKEGFVIPEAYEESIAEAIKKRLELL